MSLLITLAVAAALPADLQSDAICVVAIARAAPKDRRLEKPGREYAAIVGADIMDQTGRSASEAREVFAAALASPPATPAELKTCIGRMQDRLVDF